MENSSKALLIAAAVLIVIIVITIGIKVYTSSSETGKVAMETGDTISSKTQDATSLAISEITGKQAQSNAGSNTQGQNIGEVISEANYGDYIDLGGEGIEGIGTNSSADDWRILYNDDTNVYAILADYLPNNTLIASDVGLTTEGYCKVYGGGNRNGLIYRLINRTEWNALIPSVLVNSGSIVKGATTADIIMASYNKKYNIDPPISYTSYPSLRTNPNDSTSSIDTLYISHSGSAYNGCRGYWLASPNSYSTEAIWCINYSSLSWVNNGAGYSVLGVRPVVSLPSNIIKVKKDGEVWMVVQ